MNMDEAYEAAKSLCPDGTICCEIDRWHHVGTWGESEETKCGVTVFIPNCEQFYGATWDICIDQLMARLGKVVQELPTNEEAGINGDYLTVIEASVDKI